MKRNYYGNSPGQDMRPIEGVDSCFVTRTGEVWSSRTGRWRQLAQYRRPYGARYTVVCLRPDRGAESSVECRYVHRLVLEAFAGPCPEGMEACHNDGDTTNNRVENLRWDTRQGNRKDMFRHGTACLGERNPRAILTEAAVREIRRLAQAGMSRGELAARFHIRRHHVGSILRRDSWRHVDDSRGTVAALAAW